MENPFGFMASNKGGDRLTSPQLQFWVDISDDYITSTINE